MELKKSLNLMLTLCLFLICSSLKAADFEFSTFYQSGFRFGGSSEVPDVSGVRAEVNYLNIKETRFFACVGLAKEKFNVLLKRSSQNIKNEFSGDYSSPFLQFGYRVNSEEIPKLSMDFLIITGTGKVGLSKNGSSEVINQNIFSLGAGARLNYKLFNILDLKFGLMTEKFFLHNFDYAGNAYNAKQMKNSISLLFGVGVGM